MIEGSGSVPLTNGSGSGGAQKHMDRMDPDPDSDPDPQHCVKIKNSISNGSADMCYDAVLFKKHLVYYYYVYNTGKTITYKYLLQIICVISSRQRIQDFTQMNRMV